jgi:hypothetical protein
MKAAEHFEPRVEKAFGDCRAGSFYAEEISLVQHSAMKMERIWKERFSASNSTVPA